MPERVKRIKRELKYKGAIVDFYADTIEAPDGKTAVWDFIKHKGAAAGAKMASEEEIVVCESISSDFCFSTRRPSSKHADKLFFIRGVMPSMLGYPKWSDNSAMLLP